MIMQSKTASPAVVDWVSVPRDGEVVNGDGVIVRHDGARTLIAVMDALGHGPKAHEVTTAALAHLDTVPLDRGVAPVMDSLHLALRGSRGAAGLVFIVSNDEAECSGVGNVEMRVQRSNVPLVLSAGVLGIRMRQARVAKGRIGRPDRLVIYTDGISRKFDFHALSGLSPKEASSRIFESCRRAHDDATILVADFP